MNGGQGSVDIITKNGEKYACKHLLEGLVADPVAKHRFLREIKIAQRLNSPNIIRICEYGEDERGLYYTMPVYRQNLRSYIESNYGLYNDPIAQASIYLSVLSGVNNLHSAGIIHRDLKPENILINGIDDIVICDFGFSKDLASSSEFTSTGDGFGTDQYCSPEQMLDSKHVDYRTDIFALGKILNDLTGRLVCSAQKQLCRVADKASSYNKNDRYSNISELKKDVKAGYDIWIRRNDAITIDNLLNDISRGQLIDIELISDVEDILNNPQYSVGDADRLYGALNDKQYLIIEKESTELSLRFFEHLWEDWIDTWNGNYNLIDDMTSLVKWCWKTSESPKVKGFNLAKLNDIANTGNRYDAMKAVANMIAEISGDQLLRNEFLAYSSLSIIKENYKIIGKQLPSWLR